MQQRLNVIGGPDAIEAVVEKARQERAQALTTLILALAQALSRLVQHPPRSFRPVTKVKLG
jgi:hypothetical protein